MYTVMLFVNEFSFSLSNLDALCIPLAQQLKSMVRGCLEVEEYHLGESVVSPH